MCGKMSYEGYNLCGGCTMKIRAVIAMMEVIA